MKRWAILTILLYALALLLLTVPIILIAFGPWLNQLAETLAETFPKLAPALNKIVGHWANGTLGLNDSVKLFSTWWYWLWLAVLVAGQALLLLLPINISERRLPARRPLKIPVIVTAFFLGNLCFAGILSILCAVFKDDGLNVFAFVDKIFTKDGHMTDAGSTYSGIIITLIFWVVWAFIFHRFAKSDAPDALLKRGTRWLLRGSILELIVAVPSHVITRRRDDCCAPMGTFWGIATGISVMLLCFGPGVYFLFVERFQKLKPKSPATERNA